MQQCHHWGMVHGFFMFMEEFGMTTPLVWSFASPSLPGWMLEAARWTLFPESVNDFRAWVNGGHIYEYLWISISHIIPYINIINMFNIIHQPTKFVYFVEFHTICTSYIFIHHKFMVIKSIAHSSSIPSIPLLVGGLVAIFYFPIHWVANHPNWLSYFSEG